MNSRPIFTTPCPTLVLVSNNYILVASIPSPQISFSSITYHYHIRHNSPHLHPFFFPYMVFECRHNIRNKPVDCRGIAVDTPIPSLNSFRDIIMIGTHQQLGKLFKDIFSGFFSRKYDT